MSKSLRKLISFVLALSLATQSFSSLAAASTPGRDVSIGVIETIRNSDKNIQNVFQEATLDDRSNIETEGQSLQAAIDGRDPYHELDVFRLFAQRATDLPKDFLRRLAISAIQAEVVNSRGQVVATLSSRTGGVFRSTSNELFSFRLSFQGKKFFEFLAPIDSIGFEEGFLVFTEPNRFDRANRVDHVNFIDLERYKPLIGRSALPIFKIAVESPAADAVLHADQKGLKVGAVSFSAKVLSAFSEPQDMLLNVSANSVDPTHLEGMTPLLENFQDYFLKTLSLEGETVARQAALLAGGEEKLRAFAARTQKQLDHTNLDATSAAAFSELDKMAENMNTVMASQKKLVNRLKMLWGALTLPQPEAVPKLATAMAMVASGIKKKEIPFAEASRHILSNTSARMGLAIATGVALGATYPAETAAFFYSSLDAIRTVGELAFGKVKESAYLAKESVVNALAGFNPIVSAKAYLTPEQLPKTAIGLTYIFTTLYLAIGLPHIATNTFYLVKDFKAINWADRVRKEGSWWKAIRASFIERQNRLQKEYLAALAGDSQLSKDKPVGFTEEQNLEVENKIRELEQKGRNGFFSRWLKKSSEREAPKNMSLDSFGKALRHFIFSYATFTISGTAYTKIWNSWFAMRTFIWNPSIVASVMLYPNLWKLANSGRVAADWNGGSRNRFTELRLRAFDPSRLKALESYENSLLFIEKELSRAAMRQTLKDLTLLTQNQKALQTLFHSKKLSNIADESIHDLDKTARSFFRVHYDRLLNEGMKKYLEQKGYRPDDVLTDQNSIEAPRLPLTISSEEAVQLISQVASEEFIQDSNRISKSRLSPTAAKSRFKTWLVSNLSAENNRQIARMAVVNKQAAKPQAMARAVRGMVASTVVDKPMELLFLFLCFASVDSGLLMPIQDEMFSENSVFHTSKMIFSNGFIYGVISGVFADIWMKLQMDEKNEGSFESVPTGKDAEGSFLKYYFKKTFKDPQNTIWKNHMHNVKIMWANMKAAFTTYLLIGLLTLGRFDLDAYIVGYLFAYFSPLSAFSMKLEQGFELSSAYFAKDIPEQYRSHPRAQEYLNKTLSKKRLWFNVFFKTYENIMGNIMMSLQMGKTALLGTRSFSRMILGGFTFTEAAAVGTRSAGDVASKLIPGADRITDFCEKIFTKNFTDWEKIPPR